MGADKSEQAATGSGHLRFGLHSGQQYSTFSELVGLWQRVEDAGYDWISLFDHLRPPMFGPEGPCFESTTALAALACSTHRIRCGLLVSPPTHRHPALLAAIGATIDHVSNGRLELGLGVGSADDAFAEWGMKNPPFGIRLKMLEETCLVLRGLWEDRTFTFSGTHYALTDAHLVPKPIQHRVPLVMGGAGQALMRLVGRYADVWNSLICPLPAYRDRTAMLDASCQAAGRDPSQVRASLTFRAVLGPTAEEAAERAAKIFASIGPRSSDHLEYLAVGTPDTVADALQSYVDLGAADLILGCRPPLDTYTIDAFIAEVAPRLVARSD